MSSTITDQIRMHADRIKSLADEIDETCTQPPTEPPIEPPPIDPPIEPPPDPPIEPPPIDPPDPGGKPQDLYREMNPAGSLYFTFFKHGRYTRQQVLLRIKGEHVLKFEKLTNAGAKLELEGETYTLMVDGNAVQTLIPEDGATGGSFTIHSDMFDEGWHVFDVISDEDEPCAMYPGYVLKGEKAGPQEWMPSCTGSYDFKADDQMHRIFWVPARFDPHVPPLEVRQYTPTDAPINGKDFWLEELVPHRTAGVRIPNIDKHGIINTHGKQIYRYSSFVSKTVDYPCLDGPRGVGTVAYPTHVELGQPMCPNSGRLRTRYICEPHRVLKVFPSGEVETLFGHRHVGLPDYHEDPQNLELVGDWSAIPESRRYLHETWGMAWDSDSLETDFTAAPIPEENNMHPHVRNVIMYVTDSQNNRVLRAEFDKNRHTATIPAKITEWKIGLADPWDIVEYIDNGRPTLIVSVRGDHEIVQFDMHTGERIRTIASGPDLSYVDGNRFVNLKAPLETIRQYQCVGPEGLDIVDDWLYFGSIAMKQVKRVHLQTGETEVVVSAANGKNHYIKIAVSDGTCGPKGTVFYSSWGVGAFGGPFCNYDDEHVQFKRYSSTAVIPRGPGSLWDSSDYNAAVSARDGDISWGGADLGLFSATHGVGQVPVELNKSLFHAGRLEYYEKGYDLKYDRNGNGFYGLPLPWGESEAMDHYLEWNLHKPPASSAK